MSRVITIPKNLAKRGDLVIIPRSQYEEYLGFKKIIPFIKATQAEKRAIQAGRQEIKKGQYLSLRQLKNELEN